MTTKTKNWIKAVGYAVATLSTIILVAILASMYEVMALILLIVIMSVGFITVIGCLVMIFKECLFNKD